MAERIEDSLRRTAAEARAAGRVTVAGELADLVAEVRRHRDDLLLVGYGSIVAALEQLDEASGAEAQT